MPMLDAYIPEGALDASAEQELLEKLTDILLTWEGADPKDPAARSIAWVFLHRPTRMFVGGQPADDPRYRIVASVPEGQLDTDSRRGMVDAVTNAVLDAEPPSRKRDPFRVWVLTNQVPEGTWGAGGNVVGLADIVNYISTTPRPPRLMPRADWQSPSPNVMPSSPDPHMSCSQALAWLGCVPKPQPGQVPQRHAMICSDTHLAFEAAVEPAAASVIVDNRSRS